MTGGSPGNFWTGPSGGTSPAPAACQSSILPPPRPAPPRCTSMGEGGHLGSAALHGQRADSFVLTKSGQFYILLHKRDVTCLKVKTQFRGSPVMFKQPGDSRERCHPVSHPLCWGLPAPHLGNVGLTPSGTKSYFRGERRPVSQEPASSLPSTAPEPA